MYHLYKYGVLDHVFLPIFLCVGSKSEKAVGPTLIRVVHTMGFPLLRGMSYLSELEEYGQTGMNGNIQGLALAYQECFPSFLCVGSKSVRSRGPTTDYCGADHRISFATENELLIGTLRVR